MAKTLTRSKCAAPPPVPGRRGGWVGLGSFAALAGCTAVGAGHLVGDIGVALAGRRTGAGLAAQLLVMAAIVVLAGLVAEPVLDRLRRDRRQVFTRRRT